MKLNSIPCGFIKSTFLKMCLVSSLTCMKATISLKDGHNLNTCKTFLQVTMVFPCHWLPTVLQTA